MAVTTFCAPLLPGKTEAWKQAVAEIGGPRAADWDDMQRRNGITRQVVSLQRTPDGDFVCVFLEGDDPNATLGGLFTSDHPFDKWFADTILIGTHGMSREEGPPPPNQVFVDWIT